MQAVFALRFENLLARNSSMNISKHEKEEKLAGPTGNFAGPAPLLVASGWRLIRRLCKGDPVPQAKGVMWSFVMPHNIHGLENEVLLFGEVCDHVGIYGSTVA